MKTYIEDKIILEVYKKALKSCINPGSIKKVSKELITLSFEDSQGTSRRISLEALNNGDASFVLKYVYGDDAGVQYTFIDKQATLWNETLQRQLALESEVRRNTAELRLAELKECLDYFNSLEP